MPWPTDEPTAPQGGGLVPTQGAFATSEVLPKIAHASRELTRLQDEWRTLRDQAAQDKSAAKALRANLIVTLRVWGNEGTSGLPIKTSAERNEWADADSDVQATELKADLAQTAAMHARSQLDAAQDYFSALQSMLAIERDELKRAYSGPN